MHLPSEYGETYLEMLQVIAEAHRSNPARLTALWPLCGHKYLKKKGILVIGRAVNGWDVGWSTRQMLLSSERKRIIHYLVTKYETCSDCPMSWVVKQERSTTKYNPNRSAFWRVVHRTHDVAMDASEDWSSELCWTNLYKVAPSAGGNPPSSLQETQLPGSIRLLRMEILVWKPRIVLTLTGSDWFEPFTEALGLRLKPTRDCDLVTHWADLDGVRWVIGKHPRGKPEDQFISEISRFCS